MKGLSLLLVLVALVFWGCDDEDSSGGDTDQSLVDQKPDESDGEDEDLNSDTSLGDSQDSELGDLSPDLGQDVAADEGEDLSPDEQQEVDQQAEVVEPVGDCNDGIDNDGDGYIDWGYDLGCVNAEDDEISGSRAEEMGFTTFDVGAESLVIYVSASQGSDDNDGLSAATAVATLTKGAELVRDNSNDFLLLRRGDTWRGERLNRFKSGLDAEHPLVIASYGESQARPRIEIDGNFIDHNGRVRNHVALVGLELVSFPKIVGDAAFDGATGGGLRYVGGGANLLVEDCHFVHCELVVQSYGDGQHYEDVEIRRNIAELNYHVDTCGQNNAFRPSGMYASHVDGLTIEENLFDHNGWNEEVETACATMYNHNFYLNADDLVLRDNLIARASSMGIKMRSDSSGDAQGLLFEGNFFVDGEIGLGIGGNTDEAYRFVDATIRDNVFSQVGLGNPTERNFSWMLDMAGIDQALVERNYFLHQPWYGNAYGIHVGSSWQRGIEIRDNFFYELKGRALRVEASSSWDSVLVDANTFVDPTGGECLVQHSGGFAAVTYSNNRYSSSTPSESFCGELEGDLAAWEAASGETGASVFTANYQDPSRTISTYAQSLGLGASLSDFLAVAKTRSRHNWDERYGAAAINSYIKAGFEPAD